MEYQKYLPIGSVVRLKNEEKKVMIISFIGVDMQKKDRVYDYSGSLFPEGLLETNKSYLFNHEDIDEVFFLGYQNEEQKEFAKKLKEIATDENLEKVLSEAKKKG